MVALSSPDPVHSPNNLREKWGPMELHPGAEMPPKHVRAESPAGRPSKQQLTDNLVTQASVFRRHFFKNE